MTFDRPATDRILTLPPNPRLLASTETFVEGVHFDLAYTTARELGHKALAVTLSHQAIRAASPLYAMVSLGLTQNLSEHFLSELFHGMHALAHRFQVELVSGRTVQSPTALIVNVTVFGQANRRPLPQAGARPGDLVGVVGNVGSSAAGLNCLKKLGRDVLHGQEEILKAHLQPEPLVPEALALARTGGVTAAGHVSDSLSKELHHLAEGSEVGMLVKEADLPISSATLKAAALVDANARAWALYGAEDYTLVLTVRAARLAKVQAALAKRGRALHIIGEVKPRRSGLRLKKINGEKVELAPREWNHLARRHRRR